MTRLAPGVALALLAALGVACRERPQAPAALIPSGLLGAPPPRFIFPDVEGAASYRVVVSDPDGREIATVEGPRSPLVLPDATQRYFQRGVAYGWRVEARDAAGRPLAPASGASFTVR